MDAARPISEPLLLSANKFDALDRGLEEGELPNLIPELHDELVVDSEATSEGGVCSDNILGTSINKKKSSKQLKNSGPLRLLTRGRKTPDDFKGREGREVDSLIGSDWEFFQVPSVGLSGGIVVLWRKTLSVFKVIDYSSQVVIGDLEILNKGTWRVCSVYGKKDVYGRRPLWDKLLSHSTKELPMVIGVGSIGPRFTWCNNKVGNDRIFEKLDRCFLNSLALNSSHRLVVKQLARIASDHCPILLDLIEFKRPSKAYLKCEDTWASFPASVGVVRESWGKRSVGDSPQILNHKLKRALKALFFWSKAKHRDLNLLKDSLYKDIEELQMKEADLGSLSSDDCWLLKVKINELNSTLAQLSTWWKQRAKVKWMAEGDTNSKFFQTYASARRNANFINMIKDDNGSIIEDPIQVEQVILRFFQGKWQDRSCSLEGWPRPSCTLDDADRSLLERNLSIDEVEDVIKLGEGGISPGVDGITYSFLRAYWSIIKEDFWNAVLEFFSSGNMCKQWKETLIVLIPKVSNPMLPSNFRPINLCNTVYKVVAKVLLNRMLPMIPNLIAVEQAAFLKGRSMYDHIIVAKENFHKFRYFKSSKGLVSFKWDMAQAYDSIGWSSLANILDHFGFPRFFSKLLMECVQYPSFSIIINGNFTQWMEACSGFRQGCPLSPFLLSPFLFILCCQLLSDAFKQRAGQCGVRISTNGPRISHLLYADDVIVFSEARVQMVKVIKDILLDFCRWTGLFLNTNKSCVLFGKSVSKRKRRSILRIVGCKQVKELNYLGVKVALRRLVKNDFQFIVDKALRMINIWGSKVISLAGRILLVKSVLLTYPIFHSTLSLVPKSILQDLEKLCRTFIWSKGNGKKGLHFVKWEWMCKSMESGGRGLYSCSKDIGILRAKLAWRYSHDKDSLLHKCLFPKFGKLYSNAGSRSLASSAWKLIEDGDIYLKPIVKWSIANGRDVSVFNDTWILDKCINQWPTFVNVNCNEDLKVGDLIYNKTWNMAVLEGLFGQELVSLISNISISSDAVEDDMEMINILSGKSISALAREAWNRGRSYEANWEGLCKAKLIPRVDVFWWRVLHNAIPTNQFLSYRKLQTNGFCPRCPGEVEDVQHVVIGCKMIKEAVNRLNAWGFGIPVFNSMKECGGWMACQNQWMIRLFCNMVFFSWKSRNIKVHDCFDWSGLMVAVHSVGYFVDPALFYSLKNLGTWDANQHKLFNRWHPPPPDWIKVNVDASLLPSYKAGVAGVFRDSRGRFLFAFGHECVHWDISSLELIAIKCLNEYFSYWMSKYEVMTYMPQDFRGTLIRQQRERSERNRQALVDALVNSGGSIHDRYALLWSQQMERRRQLAQLGSAQGVYKTVVKYLVGVPQVLLDFIKQINDDQGPMEEQRQRYGPSLYSLTKMVLSIRFFLLLSSGRAEKRKMQKDQLSVIQQAVQIYTSELEKFIEFIRVVFVNSPFFISAEDAGAVESRHSLYSEVLYHVNLYRKSDDYKETVVPPGKTHEISVCTPMRDVSLVVA
ncbi:hypothetical protein M5K25_007201 [Dendrobium thyrsiflorum]|uniref:Reverse transcriptase domain-containing protein n=1 Tax=Dendrobium thyrsiflorum TaxID=117978 RepID=A0ABD0VDW2_DENTH